MWKTIKVAGCQLRIGRVGEVGTKNKWAATPTCSHAIPLTGDFDRHGRALIQAGGPAAEFVFCPKPAVFRIILEGGPMVAPSDNLSCAEHLSIAQGQLEAQAKELAELYCVQCNKFRANLPNIDGLLTAEEICQCD